MSQSFSIERLQSERKRWRQDHPPGFVARPKKLPNGDADIFNWECLIPGRAGTPWEGGFFHLDLAFPETYPMQAPVASFVPPIPHVNVFKSGRVCLSILTDGWKPSLNLRQILLGIQGLLEQPNPKSPANEVDYNNYIKNPKLYESNIRKFAALHKNSEL